jgi:hypothetical protein
LVDLATITGVSRKRYSETHCASGHELTDQNTIRRKAGGIRCRTCALRTQMNTKYGAGAADWYDSKLIEQEGLCALCGKFFGEKLCLDHNHETDEWRALVCKFCNLLIGWIENRKDIISQVEVYLTYHGKD